MVVDEDLVLAARGGLLNASDRRVLEAFAAEIAVALRQQRLEEQADRAKPLAEADRMRTALLAAVSHDLRTPLASAKAAVESLRNDEIDWSPEDHRELLATADESLARLDRLVANLLDMSRLQAGVLGLALQAVALEEVVPRSIDDLGPLRERVEGDISIELPEIAADPALLERVLVNLMANAIRYSPPEAKVLITASRHGDQVEIRVIDRGAPASRPMPTTASSCPSSGWVTATTTPVSASAWPFPEDWRRPWAAPSYPMRHQGEVSP
ncbi:hypothetical protein GCM10020219_042710 [Nonomuraea dietziae]